MTRNPQTLALTLFGAMLLVFATACQYRVADPENSAGAPSVMYQIQSIQTAWRWVEPPEAVSADGQAAAVAGWKLAPPPATLAGCVAADPCSCAGVYQATAAVIFVPDQTLQIRWLNQTGSAGNYDNGILEETPQGWVYVGNTPGRTQQCRIEDMQWDQFRRLLGFSMNCSWESDDGLCKGEDRFKLHFPSPTVIETPPPEELPWTEELEAETFRFGDDFSNMPIPVQPGDAGQDSEQAD